MLLFQIYPQFFSFVKLTPPLAFSTSYATVALNKCKFTVIPSYWTNKMYDYDPKNPKFESVHENCFQAMHTAKILLWCTHMPLK